MRKLASIQRIYQIDPIEGADRIELAHVLGWQCVVNKGQFKPMDLGVYFEIDSFLPVREEFEFLRKSCYKNTNIMGEGFKLRTQKFKGQISQGLLLPLEIFPEITSTEVGTDVTDILGIKKWEVEERATTGGTIKGTLPHSIPHTDEIRIQVEPELLNDFGDLPYYITTKMDGSSHSISIDEDGFHVTGHNFEYKDDNNNLNQINFPDFLDLSLIEKRLSSVSAKKYNLIGIIKNINGHYISIIFDYDKGHKWYLYDNDKMKELKNYKEHNSGRVEMLFYFSPDKKEK